MAINDTVFDPSKRIRATLGEEFTANVEADAISRIVSQANLGSTNSEPTPKSGPVRNQFDASAYMERIVHSNPVNNAPRHEQPVTNVTREQALKNTCNMFESTLMKNRSVPAKILMKTTGFDKNRSRAENITNAGCMIGQIATGATLEYLADVVVRNDTTGKGKMKNLASVGLIGSAIDFASAFMFAGNKDTVEGMYDPNNISQAEAALINSAIVKEKVTYAAEHVTAGFVAPLVVTNVLDKVLPEKAKANEAVRALTSFGALAAVSKTVLQGVRSFKTAKDIKALDGATYAISAGQPCEAYELIAKYATRTSIDSHIDGSIYGNIGGLVSTTIRNHNKTKSISEKLAEKALEIQEAPIPVVSANVAKATKTTEKTVKTVA